MIIILEDNIDKIAFILDKHREIFKVMPVLWFKNEHVAMSVIDALPKPVKLTLYIDGELAPGCGSGLAFLNRMIDDWPSLIQKVVVCSYHDGARKAMTELCVENSIATELIPLPFAAR